MFIKISIPFFGRRNELIFKDMLRHFICNFVRKFEPIDTNKINEDSFELIVKNTYNIFHIETVKNILYLSANLECLNYFCSKKINVCIDTLDCDKTYDYNFLFLDEPSSIATEINRTILKNKFSFDKIYTFNQDILDKYHNALFFPKGTSWLDLNQLKINKKPQVSFLTSSKNKTFRHNLRLSVYDYLNSLDCINQMEIYHHKSPPFINERNVFFENALFNIGIENGKLKNYFSEKIVDCFVSKTIPIYCGCPNIGEWFNTDGIITFNDLEDLKYIFSYINEDYYNSKQDAIEENYKIAYQFCGENSYINRVTNQLIEELK